MKKRFKIFGSIILNVLLLSVLVINCYAGFTNIEYVDEFIESIPDETSLLTSSRAVNNDFYISTTSNLWANLYSLNAVTFQKSNNRFYYETENGSTGSCVFFTSNFVNGHYYFISFNYKSSRNFYISLNQNFHNLIVSSPDSYTNYVYTFQFSSHGNQLDLIYNQGSFTGSAYYHVIDYQIIDITGFESNYNDFIETGKYYPRGNITLINHVNGIMPLKDFYQNVILNTFSYFTDLTGTYKNLTFFVIAVLSLIIVVFFFVLLFKRFMRGS